MPKDNIERAIAKGTGAGADTESYDHVMYEGYGPGGVALLVEALTRQPQPHERRGPPRVRQARRQPRRAGLGRVPVRQDRACVARRRRALPEDDLMPAVDAGAEDIVHRRGRLRGADRAVRPDRRPRGAERGRHRDHAEFSIMYRPKTHVRSTRRARPSCMKLIDTLEDLDDIDEIHANFDVHADVLERIAN